MKVTAGSFFCHYSFEIHLSLIIFLITALIRSEHVELCGLLEVSTMYMDDVINPHLPRPLPARLPSLSVRHPSVNNVDANKEGKK